MTCGAMEKGISTDSQSSRKKHVRLPNKLYSQDAKPTARLEVLRLSHGDTADTRLILET